MDKGYSTPLSTIAPLELSILAVRKNLIAKITDELDENQRFNFLFAVNRVQRSINAIDIVCHKQYETIKHLDKRSYRDHLRRLVPPEYHCYMWMLFDGLDIKARIIKYMRPEYLISVEDLAKMGA